MNNSPMKFSEEFKAALHTVNDDFHRYGHLGDEEMTEEGSLRVCGIARADTVRLLGMNIEEFGPDLMAGGPEQATALLGIIEMSVAIGVRLERARWEGRS